LRLNPQVKMVLFVLVILCFLLVLVFQVWGDSMRMARANALLTNERRVQAANRIYADLAVKHPDSPHILHNLALSTYENHRFTQALEVFTDGLAKLEKPENGSPLSSRGPQELTYKYRYHLGNTNFKLAEEGKLADTQRRQYLEAALDHYQKALLIDASDPDAKYNYELTKLHLQLQDEKRPDEAGEEPGQTQNDDKNQNNQGKNDEEDSRDRTDDHDSPSAALQDQSSAPEKNATGEEGMSKEEAVYLLDLTKMEEEYYTPQNNDEANQGVSKQPEKDW